MKLLNMFRNVRTDTRIWNRAYQKGFEEGCRRASMQASTVARHLADKYDSQFKERYERPCPLKAEEIIVGIEMVMFSPRVEKFYAEAVHGIFEIWPNQDGYATWENIDDKFDH